MTIQVPVGDTTPYYWKAVAYDTFDGAEPWSIYPQDNVKFDNPADDRRSSTAPGTRCRSPEAAATRSRSRSRKIDFAGRTDLLAGCSSSRSTCPTKPHRRRLRSASSAASRPRTAGPPTRPRRSSRDRRRMASRRTSCAPRRSDYPAEIRACTSPIAPGIFGPGSHAARRPRSRRGPWRTAWLGAPGRRTRPAFCAQNAYDPYDLAVATKDGPPLRTSSATRPTSPGLDCQNISTVECFAEFKQRLLPVLRHDDGDDPALPRRPDPVWPRAGCPAPAMPGRASRRSC